MNADSLVSQVARKALKKKIPLSCHFDLTYHCNLDCVHCYIVKEKRSELDTDTIKATLDKLANLGTLYLTFSGGEVLTRDDFFEIADYARKLNFALKICTNGVLIDEEVADKITAINPDLLTISIYSTSPEIHDQITNVKGSFQKSMEALELLGERGVKLRISTAIMQQNINDYKLTHELSQSLGASFVADKNITPKMDKDKNPLKYQINKFDVEKILSDPLFQSELEEKAKRHINKENHDNDLLCEAANVLCYISPYGDVFPCVQLPIYCGNIKEEPLDEIWNNSPQLNEIREMRIRDLPKCSKCDVFTDCNFCPGIPFLEDGNMKCPSQRVCEEAKIYNKLVRLYEYEEGI